MIVWENTAFKKVLFFRAGYARKSRRDAGAPSNKRRRCQALLHPVLCLRHQACKYGIPLDVVERISVVIVLADEAVVVLPLPELAATFLLPTFDVNDFHEWRTLLGSGSYCWERRRPAGSCGRSPRRPSLRHLPFPRERPGAENHPSIGPRPRVLGCVPAPSTVSRVQAEERMAPETLRGGRPQAPADLAGVNAVAESGLP